MALYRYLKNYSSPPQRLKDHWWPFLFLLTGLFFLTNAVLPIFLYQVQSRVRFQPLLSPIGKEETLILGETAATDYDRPAAWFPAAPELPSRPSLISHYRLSIPKLKIDDAIVEINGQDLMKSLVHYQGTALPGQIGNAVIFGHSTLPQFFNPRNYKTIFSPLTNLEKGDEVLVDYDGIQYRYMVVRMTEVSPGDYSVLTQNRQERYLSLITCVPQGTYLRRLVVLTKLS